MITSPNPRLTKTTSGKLCIVLTDAGTWESFPQFAENLSRQLRASVVDRVDGPDIRLWKVQIDGVSLRLVYGGYPNGVCLESSDVDGDALLEGLFTRFNAESRADGV